MSQQINLLNPALIKQKDLLNPNTIGMMLLLMTGIMIAYTAYAQKELKLLALQSTTVAAELASSQSLLTQMAAARAPREPNKALVAQIAALEQKEEIQLEVMEIIRKSANSQEKSYAALMTAFARQTLDGLWLTGFSYNSMTQALNLTGRTLEANLVPEYITALSREPVLKGKTFSGLNMAQPKVGMRTEENPSTSQPIPTQTSPMTSALPSPLAASSAKPLPVKPKPQYLEFSLQSVDRNTTETKQSNPNNTQTNSVGSNQGAPS